MKKLIIAFITITTFYSCDKVQFTGEGDIVTREFNLPQIDRFSSEGSFDVFVEQGAEQSVIVEGEENIIDRLVTKVNNGRWDIKLKPGSYSKFSLTVRIVTPDIEEMIVDGSGDVFIGAYNVSKLRLRSRGSGDFIVSAPMTISNLLDLDIEGSGEITIPSLDCQNLEMDVEGSGNIAVNGTTQNAVYYVDGSGDIRAFDMVAQTGSATNQASGDIELMVANQLDVYIGASGNVAYKGNPSISQKITGSGKLIDRN